MRIEAKPVQVIEAPAKVDADEWAAIIAAAGALIGAIVGGASD